MTVSQSEVLVPIQTGFVVDNLDAALVHWTEVVGAGPFYVTEVRQWKSLTHMGEPTAVEMRIALGQWGPMQIEFIEQLNDAPSPYKDFISRGHRGLHHFGVLVDDLNTQVASFTSRGQAPVYVGESIEGLRFAYLIDDVHPGAMIELIERGPVANGLFAMVADAARDWDGSVPVRHL